MESDKSTSSVSCTFAFTFFRYWHLRNVSLDGTRARTDITTNHWFLNITPFVDSVKILEVLVEGATAVDFVIGNLLDENALNVGLRQVNSLLNNIFPVECWHFEKRMFFNLRDIATARA